jgi:hypothetical protein
MRARSAAQRRLLSKRSDSSDNALGLVFLVAEQGRSVRGI